VCDFLLVINIATLVLSCTVSEIRWFIGRKNAKIASSYPPQSHKSPSFGVTPFKFWDSWAHPRGAQLSAGYTVPTPPNLLYSQRPRRLYSCARHLFWINGVPYHCASAPLCDLLNQTSASRWMRTDRHDLPTNQPRAIIPVSS